VTLCITVKPDVLFPWVLQHWINLAVNSMFFIWNDNVREKREATPLHANASMLTHTDSWYTIRAVAIGGVWGVWHPLKTSCWQMKGFVGKQKIIYHKTLSYIRFTVGQYWLRIKKNGKNSVNFRKFCSMSPKILVCPKNFWTPKMVHWLKFFWGGGGWGEVVKNNFVRKIFFVGKFYTHTPPV
jgi:hypothetical protein